MKFEIVRRGATVDGVELEIGAVVEADSLPAWLVGKAVEVESEKVLEVATPKRGPGRPPKE